MKRTYILKNSRNGQEMPDFKTVVDVELTETELVFNFTCENSQRFSAYEGYNTDIFDGDVCEAFICTDGSMYNYYELELAPNNSVFCTRVNNPENDFDKAHSEYEPVNFVRSSVEFTENGYNAMFALPLDKIGYNKEKGIFFNIYRIETEGGECCKHLLAANPTLCDSFHRFTSFFEFK